MTKHKVLSLIGPLFILLTVLVGFQDCHAEDSSHSVSLAARKQLVQGPNLKNLTVWSEFLTYRQVESQLPSLQGRNSAINIAVHAENPQYDDLVHLYRQAQVLGVTIRPWLLLDIKDLYWFNKWNLEASGAFVHSFLSQMRSRGINPDWLIFDVEPRQEVTDQLLAVVQNRGDSNLSGLLDIFTFTDELSEGLDVLSRWSEDGKISQATTYYQNLVNELHSQNVIWQTIVSGLRVLLELPSQIYPGIEFRLCCTELKLIDCSVK